ncbi:hypothetical protein [Streptomyces sp. NPDC093094]|uniref:hypothetical protein n=1 Tax=Streptomyces sp. NPDC093094 TaxID=3366026 RepID=UPI00382746D9
MNEDELLARLRAADPALVHEAPAPDVDRLLEATMTTSHVPAGPRVRQPIRRPRLLAAAAAAVLAAAGLAAWQAASGSPGSAPSAAPLVLTVSDTGGGTKCAAPTVGLLRTSTTAFEGTVTSVADGQVTLRVEHWYRGEDVTTVTLRQARETESGTFTAGDSYLVAARDGRVEMCGGTTWAEPQMRDLYREAFPPQR